MKDSDKKKIVKRHFDVLKKERELVSKLYFLSEKQKVRRLALWKDKMKSCL